MSGLFIGFGYTLLQTNSPATYTAKVDIQIGKIANVNIESAGDIYAFLQSDAFIEGDERLRKIGISFNDFQNVEYPGSRKEQFQLTNYEEFQYTTVLTLSYVDQDAGKAKKLIQKALNKLQKRHDTTYAKASDKFKEFKRQLGKLQEDSVRNLPFLWLDSYTYPTRVIKAAEASKNVPPDRTSLILVLTTIAFFFISIMMAFLIEGIRNRISGEKIDQAK